MFFVYDQTQTASKHTKPTQHLQVCTTVQYPPGWTGAFVDELAPELMDRPFQLSLPAPVPFKAAPQQRPAVAAAAAAAAPAAPASSSSEMPPPEVPLPKRRRTGKQPPPEPVP